MKPISTISHAFVMSGTSSSLVVMFTVFGWSQALADECYFESDVTTWRCQGDLTSFAEEDTDGSDTAGGDYYGIHMDQQTDFLTNESDSVNYGLWFTSTGKEGENHSDDSTSGRELEIVVDGQNGDETYGIQVTGSVVYSTSSGGKGHSGNDNGSDTSTSSHEGGDGRDGGAGGPVLLYWDSGLMSGNDVTLGTYGGDGGEGGSGKSDLGNGHGGEGGAGGSAESITLSIGETAGVDANILLLSVTGQGGEGGHGGEGLSGIKTATGGKGGVGGAGADIDFTLYNYLNNQQDGEQTFVNFSSIGGEGGHGGNANGDLDDSKAGNGGTGGDGGDINFDASQGYIKWNDHGSADPTFTFKSQAGHGGSGGDGSNGYKASGGDGAEGGVGGDVIVDLSNSGNVVQNYHQPVIVLQSLGGSGGDGGDGSGGLSNGKSGGGGGGGGAGNVSLAFNGFLGAGSENSDVYGLVLQSVGGLGGVGGSSSGLDTYGASGQAGGASAGASLTLYDETNIGTNSDYGVAAYVQSVGGGGGIGGSADGIVALGGDGSAGGDGGTVSFTGRGAVNTNGDNADAIVLQSQGGSGGASGSSTGLVAIGGDAGSAGDGGAVTIDLNGTIGTKGEYSDALHAQTIGGGGGRGHSTSGMTSIGGTGGDGGDGGTINATLNMAVGSSGGATISTEGEDSDGIFLQSAGGGGGSGSNSISVGAEFSSAIGGNGGAGGDGGAITVVGTGTGAVETQGDHSTGIYMQSIGGGGGDGGYGISASAGAVIDMSVGAGGDASAGGDGAAVSFTGANGASAMTSVTTAGDHSAGIHAQSVGGGGGTGGMSISSANSSNIAASTSIGGEGGTGGDASAVTVSSAGNVATSGDNSTGIKAQSVGGGGGSSGISIDANAVSDISLSAAVGRAAGSGGSADTVSVDITGTAAISSTGDASDGVFAQSVGGNGGNAALVVAATGSSTADADLSIGGAGGAGGDAGSVSVSMDDTTAVSTEGSSAIGINAQSIGGGGGHGSMTIAGSLTSSGAVNLAVGGTGGGSGDAADVTLGIASTVSTAGDNSIGILAKSVGGSGGSGGISIAGDGTSTGAATVSVSGNGGGGHTAGSVSVSTDNLVQTAGDHATAVKAMSVGGGGGSATAAISGTTSSMGQAQVTVGGEGGGGGTGGDVSVEQSGQVLTSGDYADAIMAMSLGGSGGHGAFSAAGSLSAGEYSAQTGVTIGGAGGGGGSSGTVTVATSTSTVNSLNQIKTYGYASRGILASSVGGNGGFGGSSYSGALTLSSDAGMQADVTVGGNGGSGGVGDNVSVENTISIVTAGAYSDGIMAMSIGGDGGYGGNAVAAAIQMAESSSANFEAAVGGSGAGGGTAGDVSVTNSAAVTTNGVESHGLYAQSVGGGGGRAGNAGTAIFDYTSSQQGTTDKTGSVNVGISVGGKGGSGNHGGDVTVNNTGNIKVGYEEYDDNGSKVADRISYGIFAQSVGGGGGDGGSVSGYNQSVVGACTFDKFFLPSSVTCASSTDEDSPKTTYSASANVEIGGNGSNGGDGGAVVVDNAATIETEGTESYGIFAQSIGGGGGNGGGGSLGLEYVLPDATADEVLGYISAAAGQGFSNVRSFRSVSAIVGGQGESGGDGDAVTVTNSGSISTAGFAADAILAQSIGGGGGNGGTASTGAGSIGEFAVGGTGGNGGNGHKVNVESPGYIATTGIDAMGVFAQSVGGGGGRAGAVARALTGEFGVDLNVGIAVGTALVAGDGGNGGEVDVTIGNASDGSGGISTTGIRGHGVWAQSIGGGGGASSWGGLITDAESEAISWAGGGADNGAGGDVNVTVNAPISVSGAGAVGVFAQSVSGADVDAGSAGGQTAGDVALIVNSDITATGADGRGVFLQSDGYDGDGAISLTVNEGGSITASEDTTEAILWGMGNSDNSLVNHGTIKRSEAFSLEGVTYGYALKNHDGEMTVDNYGIWEGSVSLVATKGNGSATENAFNNYEDASLGLGIVFDLGTSTSQLTNDGTMSAGSIGSVGGTLGDVATTQLTGSITQSDTGSLWVDFDFDSNSGDLISIQDGPATLAGTVVANPVDHLPINSATGSIEIVHGATTVETSDLTVWDTAIVTYGLAKTTSNGEDILSLNYDVNYAAWESEPTSSGVNDIRDTTSSQSSVYASNPNLNSVAGYLGRLADARNTAVASGSDEFSNVDAFVFPLLAVETVEEVVEIYEHVASADILRLSDASLRSSYRFSERLMSCPEANEDGQISYSHEGTCSWFSFGGLTRNADADNGDLSFDENTWSIAGGAQIEVSDGWFLGGALSYEGVSYSTSISSGDGDRYNVGAVLKRENKNRTYALSLSGGRGDYSLSRNSLDRFSVSPTENDISNSWLALHGRVSQLFERSGGSFIEPYFDLGVTWVGQDGSEIGGSLPFSLDVGSSSTTKYSINPGVEFGWDIETKNGPMDMRFGVGYLGIFGDDFESDVSAVDHAATAGTFRSTSNYDDQFLELKARIAGRIGKQTTLKLSVGALLGENEQTYGGDLRLSYLF